jgi:polar amino acid transport system permease protein
MFGTIRWIGSRVLEPLCWAYVEFARNTPPVVQILFWYFSASYILPRPLFLGLRDFGYEFGAAVIALAVYHGAFFAEVFRAGLNAVPQAQLDAARALGLGFVQSLRKVALPQAVRIVIPPLLNEATALIKNTSLAMAIGVAELTYQYRAIDNLMFRGIEALTAITAIYLLLCLLTVGVGNLVNRALSRHVRHGGPAVELRSEPA